MSLDGPLGEDQLVGDGPVGKAGRDQLCYLPLAPGQRITSLDGLLKLVGETFGAVSRPGHLKAARLYGGLPGEHPGLAVVATGSPRSQGVSPLQPGEGDEWPGAKPRVDRHGLGEVVKASSVCPSSAASRPSGQCSEPDRFTRPVPVAPV